LKGIAIKYLNQLVSVEVNSTKEPNTIFRGNSLATKSLDYFMKLIGFFLFFFFFFFLKKKLN